MKYQVLSSLTFFTFFLNHAFHANAINVEIQNNCLHPIWPAIVTTRGQPVQPSGFKLDYLQLQSMTVPDNWSGRIFPRTFCSTTDNKFHCDVGDCRTGDIRCHDKAPSPPTSVIVLDLAPGNEKSTYFIEYSDGFNVPVSVTPLDNSCKRIFCLKDLKLKCPNWLAVRDSEGGIMACKSACLATNDVVYCCRGTYVGAGHCVANPYSSWIDNECPFARSNAYSPRKYQCVGGVHYRINFC